ncbi:hypothetical protein HPB50_005480 [Hyalomma asiaticum]|uniref:Uncharacterized protein n=1 Tax=Hyalomma asiaticum TaxID=266040 RepID=A0ACB7SFB7_HYAAI|nr:hypothetical protein HPB50_005480 [Hyalomma asiaticum]
MKMEIPHGVDGNILSKTEIAKKYNITENTLSTYTKNRESITAGHKKQKVQPSSQRLRHQHVSNWKMPSSCGSSRFNARIFYSVG